MQMVIMWLDCIEGKREKNKEQYTVRYGKWEINLFHTYENNFIGKWISNIIVFLLLK